jgi:hypothetical protein
LLDPGTNNNEYSCILARIEGGSDGITLYPTIAEYITENNNVSIRNVRIVDNVVDFTEVFVGNVTPAVEHYDFYVGLNEPSIAPDIFDEAEVTIGFDSRGWQLFTDAGLLNNPGIKVLRSRLIQVIDPNLWIRNVEFPKETRVTLTLNVNFLAKKLTDTELYEFKIAQYRINDDNSTLELGTENFEVIKNRKDGFVANAGEDKNTTNNEQVSVEAMEITDPAVYNWYDEIGNLIYTGSDFASVQQLTQKYKLEVIRVEDGMKDYDEVIVNVKKTYLKGISPVPASDQVTIQYITSGLPNAYLSIVNFTGTSSTNYMLPVHGTEKSIDVSNWFLYHIFDFRRYNSGSRNNFHNSLVV